MSNNQNENDKEFFLETYNSDDEELTSHLGLTKKKKKEFNNEDINRKLIKNNSALQITSNKQILPKLNQNMSATNLNLSGINANNQQKKRNELNRQSSLIKAGENILKSSDMPNIMYKNKNMESQTGVSLLVNNPDVSLIK